MRRAADGAAVAYCRTPRRFRHLVRAASSSPGRRPRALAAGDLPKLQAMRAGWCACARAPTWSLRHHVHGRTTTAQSRTTATRARPTPSSSAATPGSDAGAVPSRAGALGRRGRRHAADTRQEAAGDRPGHPRIIAAYEDLAIDIGGEHKGEAAARDELLMEVTFWGVRGSSRRPVPPRSATGETPPACRCAPVSGTADPRLRHRRAEPGAGSSSARRHGFEGSGRAAFLLSHAHWDHIQGFPFFNPFTCRQRLHDLWRRREPGSLEGILEADGPAVLPGADHEEHGISHRMHAVRTGPPLAVPARRRARRQSARHRPRTGLSHRDGDNRWSMRPTPAMTRGPSAEALELYRGADLLIHDSTYTPEDRARHLARGSPRSPKRSVRRRAQVRKLALFHYDQDYSDADVDVLTEEGRCASCTPPRRWAAGAARPRRRGRAARGGRRRRRSNPATVEGPTATPAAIRWRSGSPCR